MYQLREGRIKADAKMLQPFTRRQDTLQLVERQRKHVNLIEASTQQINRDKANQ